MNAQKAFKQPRICSKRKSTYLNLAVNKLKHINLTPWIWHTFRIEMTDRIHYMYCTSEQEKQQWITILKWKFSCIER